MALDAIPAKKRDYAKQCFKEAEPDVRKAIVNGKPVLQVLSAFNGTYGLTISAPTFRKWLAETSPGEEAC